MTWINKTYKLPINKYADLDSERKKKRRVFLYFYYEKIVMKFRWSCSRASLDKYIKL